MSSNVVKLGDICKIGSSKRIKRDDYVENGVPFFRSKEIIELSKGNSISTELFIAKDQYNQINEKFGSPDTGDILITSVGTLGVAYQVEQSQLPFYFKDGNLTWLSQFSEDVNPRWVLYWLNSPEGQRKIDEISIGSTQRAITIVALKSIEVQLPHKDEQDRTVKILDSVTGKISTNNKTNQTLEQIAQAIFKSWFVDFDPVRAKIETLAAGGSADDAELAAMRVISAKTLDELNSLKACNPEQFNKLAQIATLFPAAMQDSELGEIPEGWEVGKLANIIDFNPRRTLKKGTLAPYLDMKNVPTTGHLAIEVVDREMASGTKFANGDTLLARITPCLENGKTAYVDFLKDNQVGWGSTEYIVMRPKEGYPTSIGYLLARDTNFRQQAIQTMTGTSGRQRADAKALAETVWLIYPKELVRAFDKTAKGYLSLAKINGDESKSLSEIRDALLPKLLSGELVGE
ncbi:restriction endonuclease subunit S [Vibrio vulnificus]|uniref:restriction endonuclease subunit S n=1 Tax=Vibrio vulnificus TaxID=672 RepID=UPI0032ED3A11